MVRVLVILIWLPTVCGAQIWDFTNVEKLPANVNTDYEESSPLLTPDGKTLYFSRILYPQNEGGRFSGSDIWVSSQVGDKTWSKASGLSLNDKGNNAVIGMNGDGTLLYVLNTTGAAKPSGVHLTKRTGKSWSRPELIPIDEFDPKGFLGFYVSPDFEVIFISMKADDSRGEEDLYVSTKNSSGQWSKPKNLGSSVNTNGFEISPFLSKDKKRLYFASNGHKGVGDSDIFYSDRLYNSWDTWSAPRNLGEKVNSKGFEAYFSLYGDTLAYFCSNKNGKFSDIYRAKVVPGSEVLAFGQRYLNDEEINKMLGANVSRKITFEDRAVDVSPAQKELIFYIANKLAGYRDINIHVGIIEENAPELTNQRLETIARYLRESGVDGFRILAQNSGSRNQSKDKASFEILLFK
jgi:hypothetical protein